MKAPQGQWSPRYTGLALVVSGPGGRQLGGLVGLGAAKLQQGWVPVSAAAQGLAGRGGSAGNLAMALWSALGFLFLPRSQSCSRSRPRQSRPQQDASSSLTTKTTQQT